MRPDMSVQEMNRELVFIVRGSCVIDTSVIDWTKPVTRDCLYTLSELKNDLGAAKVKLWLASRHRRRYATFEEAITALNPTMSAFNADLDGFDHLPIIITKEQVDTILENGLKRIEAECLKKPWSDPDEPYEKRLAAAIAARDRRKRKPA